MSHCTHDFLVLRPEKKTELIVSAPFNISIYVSEPIILIIIVNFDAKIKTIITIGIGWLHFFCCC